MNISPTAKKVVKSAKTHFALFGIQGLVKRALAAASAKHEEFKAPIPGSPKKIILRLGTTDVAAFEHVFVNGEYGFSLTESPSVIVDAGANVGMSAVYFTLRYPKAKVFAIEPEPSNFEILQRNAQLFPQITPINAALWNHKGWVQVQENGGGHWSMRATEIKTPTRTAIRATTLDSLMRDYQIRTIDLLKVDVEGAEYEIFEGASPWIDRVSVICAELHDRFRPGCAALYQAATKDFPIRWQRGELHCVARAGLIAIR